MRTVRAYLQGGLGNQCFIYATARALSLRAGASLELDFDYFKEDKVYRRQFELDAYQIAGSWKLGSCKPIRVAKKIRYAVASKLRLNGLGNYQNDYYPYPYRELPTMWRGALTLDGYWQSERYYYDAREQLLQDFQLKDKSWMEADKIAMAIQGAKCPVFVHMRSYKEVPSNDGAMPVTEHFYEKAIQKLRERLGKELTLFLFSDDLLWAQERMSRIDAVKGMNVILSNNNGQGGGRDEQIPSNIRDFELLRMCHHGIVANSSFSRFAAWLGEQQNLKDGRHPLYIHNSKKKNGYCPDRWMRIEEE